MLRDVIYKYEFLFDRTLVTWKKKTVVIELQLGAKLYYEKPYLVPRVHKAVLWKEVEQLCQLGVLQKLNCSVWGSLTFIQPKRNGTVKFLSDFRKINQRIR